MEVGAANERRMLFSEDRRYLYLANRRRMNTNAKGKHMTKRDKALNRVLRSTIAEHHALHAFIDPPYKLIVTSVRARNVALSILGGPLARRLHNGNPYMSRHGSGAFALELFDLESDPTESTNLLLGKPELVEAVEPLLRAAFDRRLPRSVPARARRLEPGLEATIVAAPMLHVVTVHWNNDAWIEPQLRFVRQNAPSDHRVYASLNGIDPSFVEQFDYAADLEGGHAAKLNELATVVRAHADPDDLLLFLDGDAFPIAPFDEALLGGLPLAAVRRSENLGDPQPHPCFCLTTVGFWFEIEGDWSRGYEWESSIGVPATDVGGNLLGILNERDIEWRPLLRTNQVNLDQLWFGIYDNVAYHHGAGFRRKVARHQELVGNSEVRARIDQGQDPGLGPGARSRGAQRAPPRCPPERQPSTRCARRRERGALERGLRLDPDRPRVLPPLPRSTERRTHTD